MRREAHRWYSHRVGRDMGVLVLGHWGPPLIMFPTSGGDEWYWLNGERWRRIPDDIIHWGKSAPGGKPTLFVYSGAETCFFPGDGGI